MIELGWMVVVTVVALLAWHRLGRLEVAASLKVDELKMIRDLQEQLSAWPDPEELIGQVEEIETRLKAMESAGNTIGAVVSRANDITKDMLAVKTMVAEHREIIALLRSKGSLRALTGTSE